MREIILVGGQWCPSCHAMLDWFFTVEIPGITFHYMDIEELQDQNITSLPAILFMEDGVEVQRITGAVGKVNFVSKVNSIWRVE